MKLMHFFIPVKPIQTPFQ